MANDRRFRDPQRADDAYAEAWALCYHLVRTHPQQFARYVQQIGSKPPLGQDPEPQRLQEFQQALQQDLTQLDAELLRASAQWH